MLPIMLVEKAGKQWDVILGTMQEPIGAFIPNFGKIMFLPAGKTMLSAEMLEVLLASARDLQELI